MVGNQMKAPWPNVRCELENAELIIAVIESDGSGNYHVHRTDAGTSGDDLFFGSARVTLTTTANAGELPIVISNCSRAFPVGEPCVRLATPLTTGGQDTLVHLATIVADDNGDETSTVTLTYNVVLKQSDDDDYDAADLQDGDCVYIAILANTVR